MEGLPLKHSIVMEGLANFDHITFTDSVSLLAAFWCFCVFDVYLTTENLSKTS